MIERLKKRITITMFPILVLIVMRSHASGGGATIQRMILNDDNRIYAVWSREWEETRPLPSVGTKQSTCGLSLVVTDLSEPGALRFQHIPWSGANVPYAWNIQNKQVACLVVSPLSFGYKSSVHLWNISCEVKKEPSTFASQNAASHKDILPEIKPLSLMLSSAPTRDALLSIYLDMLVLPDRVVVSAKNGQTLSIWDYDLTRMQNSNRFRNKCMWRLAGVYNVSEDVTCYRLVWAESLGYMLVLPNGDILVHHKNAFVRHASARLSQNDIANNKNHSERKDPHCIILEFRKAGQYLMLRWNGKIATPLDVRDKEGKNIAPFLRAKDVDERIIRAVTVMMLQRDKDEKEVDQVLRKQKEERKKKVAEEAKNPKSMTLQERLQQTAGCFVTNAEIQFVDRSVIVWLEP